MNFNHYYIIFSFLTNVSHTQIIRVLQWAFNVLLNCLGVGLVKYKNNQEVIEVSTTSWAGSWVEDHPTPMYPAKFARLMRPNKVETCHVALVFSNSCSEELWELVCESTKWLIQYVYIYMWSFLESIFLIHPVYEYNVLLKAHLFTKMGGYILMNSTSSFAD